MSDVIKRWGYTFKVSEDYDHDQRAPWIEYDCTGIIREVKTGYSKRPYERFLNPSDRNNHRHSLWVYDWNATLDKAKKEGWGIDPQAAVGMTKKQQIEAAVKADFDRMAGWLNNDWYYIHIWVSCVETQEDSMGIGGVESDCYDYINELIEEQISEVCPLTEFERKMFEARDRVEQRKAKRRKHG